MKHIEYLVINPQRVEDLKEELRKAGLQGYELHSLSRLENMFLGVLTREAEPSLAHVAEQTRQK